MKKNTVNILNVEVSATNYPLTLKKISHLIKEGREEYICVAAVHLVMEAQKNRQLLKGVNRAAIVVPDGIPLVWLLKFHRQKNVERVYGPDLTLKLSELATKKNWPIFLLGGKNNQSKKLKRMLKEKFPSLNIVGTQDTPVRPIPKKESLIIIKKIKDSQAKIIFVGLGCPLQEKWMIDNISSFNKGVFIGVGAAFDFITKEKKQAPKWMQSNGLEWFFRLVQEPRRLAKRYLVLNTLFVFKIGKQLITNSLKLK